MEKNLREPLLANSAENTLNEGGITTIATHSAIFILGIVMTWNLMAGHSIPAAKRGQSLTSPLSTIQYKIDKPPKGYWENKLFMGEPSYESDYAWNDLMSQIPSIRLSPNEAARLDMTESIMLSNGDFSAISAVTHNLHCLRRVRQYIHDSYYYPNITKEERERLKNHNVHCLEMLRTSIMCRADLTLQPKYYSGLVAHNVSGHPDALRECVDWDALQSVLRSRAYNRQQLIGDDTNEDQSH